MSDFECLSPKDRTSGVDLLMLVDLDIKKQTLLQKFLTISHHHAVIYRHKKKKSVLLLIK